MNKNTVHFLRDIFSLPKLNKEKAEFAIKQYFDLLSFHMPPIQWSEYKCCNDEDKPSYLKAKKRPDLTSKINIFDSYTYAILVRWRYTIICQLPHDSFYCKTYQTIQDLSSYLCNIDNIYLKLIADMLQSGVINIHVQNNQITAYAFPKTPIITHSTYDTYDNQNDEFIRFISASADLEHENDIFDLLNSYNLKTIQLFSEYIMEVRPDQKQQIEDSIALQTLLQ